MCRFIKIFFASNPKTSTLQRRHLTTHVSYTHTRAYNRLNIYLNHQSGVSKSKHTQLIRVVCPPYLLPSSLRLYEKKVFKYLLVWDYKIYHFNCLKVLLTKLRSYKDLPFNANFKLQTFSQYIKSDDTSQLPPFHYLFYSHFITYTWFIALIPAR